MKLVYQAANSIEAHMILHQLEQAGLNGRIDGEFLQGGVGELQANGIIRVMVEESDYAAAKAIVTEWDAVQPAVIEKTPKSTTHPLLAGFIGFILGLGSLSLYYYSSVTYGGIDYNNDGTLDEKWFYLDGNPSRTEVDRNLDGKVDLIDDYGRTSLIKSSQLDDNFDGIFESNITYKQGQAISFSSDTTGDGFQDYRETYTSGTMQRATYIDPVSKQPTKVLYYDGLRLISGKIDSDRDGKLDTQYKYNEIAEIIEKILLE